jgi:hypothetical protein
MAVLRGGAADEVAAEVLDGEPVGTERLNIGARAVREAGDLAEGDALGLDLVEGLAAVEHGLVEPPPGAFPSAAGVDGERVEDDGQGGEAAECGLGLRLEDGDEGEESLHGARREGLREEAFSLRRREVHRRRRREDPPVQRRHRCRHLGLDATSSSPAAPLNLIRPGIRPPSIIKKGDSAPFSQKKRDSAPSPIRISFLFLSAGRGDDDAQDELTERSPGPRCTVL